MRLFLALLAALLGAGLPQLGTAEVLRVILPPEAFRGMPASRFHPKATAYWQPSFEDVDRMETKIKVILLGGDKDDSRRESMVVRAIPSHSLAQRRQYVGLVVEGKRILHGNFFPKRPKWNGFMDWKTQYVLVDDGGSQHWRIHFRCEDSEFLDIDFNGEA